MENNIIFMGTPDFAVKSLDYLLKKNIKINCVITSRSDSKAFEYVKSHKK